MKYNWLPSLAKKYGVELCDQRAIWKRYLADYALGPMALMKVEAHLGPK